MLAFINGCGKLFPLRRLSALISGEVDARMATPVTALILRLWSDAAFEWSSRDISSNMAPMSLPQSPLALPRVEILDSRWWWWWWWRIILSIVRFMAGSMATDLLAGAGWVFQFLNVFVMCECGVSLAIFWSNLKWKIDCFENTCMHPSSIDRNVVSDDRSVLS